MKNNEARKLANIERLKFVAAKLGSLCDEVVFLGGCTTALFMTDMASPDVRFTLDVDCIVDIISYQEYRQLEKRLQACGFKQSPQDDITCRWRYNDMILDVVPSNEKILGFSNQWYKIAIQHAIVYSLTKEIKIKLVTAPYFLATKLDAFKDRGNNDFYASHDIEDIISVVDGRAEIVDEIVRSDKMLKKYLIEFFSSMNSNRLFHDALPGHFIHYGDLADERIELFLAKIKLVSNMAI